MEIILRIASQLSPRNDTLTGAMKQTQHKKTKQAKEPSPAQTLEAILPVETDAAAAERLDHLDMILADLKRPAAELSRNELAKMPTRFKWALRSH